MSPPSSAEATDAHTVPREVRSSPLHERHVHIHARFSPLIMKEKVETYPPLPTHQAEESLMNFMCSQSRVIVFVCVCFCECLYVLFVCLWCVHLCMWRLYVCVFLYVLFVCRVCTLYFLFVYLCVCACPCVVILFCLYLFSRVYLFTCAYICLHLRVLYPQDIVYRKVVQNLYYKHNSNLFSFSVCQGPIACLRHGIICLRSQNVTELYLTILIFNGKR